MAVFSLVLLYLQVDKICGVSVIFSAHFFKQREIIASFSQSSRGAFPQAKMIYSIGIFANLFLNHFDIAVFCSEQISVFEIRFRLYINISAFVWRNGKHIIQVDDSVIFYFNKVETLFHSMVFLLE